MKHPDISGVADEIKPLPIEFDALLHGILGIRALPPATRRAWGAFFEQYVFGDDAGVTAHIPEQRRGILGSLSAEQLAGLRAHLAKRLAR